MMLRALRSHRTHRARTIASIVGGFLLLISARSALSDARRTCDDTAYRTFDFWVGDWDAYDSDQPGQKVAHAVVELILNRCVLHEIYEAADGHRGESFTIYDGSRRTWHQTWVTDHGQLLTIEGGLQDGAMVLNGADRTPDGTTRQVRGSWKAEKEGVREIAVRSTDDGHSWQPWFDLAFRPHAR
jgi:hypothetical protein